MFGKVTQACNKKRAAVPFAEQFVSFYQIGILLVFGEIQHPYIPFAAESDHRFTAHPFVLISAIAEANLVPFSHTDLLKIGSIAQADLLKFVWIARHE